MAKVREMDHKAWDEWVATRPESVQALCKKLPPDRLYRMKSTGSRVTLVSYAEDGTVRVNITGEHNAIMFERQVFGVKADDLEECDLPATGESLGAMLTEPEDVEAFIEAVRPAILAARKQSS